MIKHISLSGCWQATWTDGEHGRLEHFLQPASDPPRYLEFGFPGSIQRNLEALGIIDDPRVGINALKARWVEEQYWILRREFDVPAEAAGLPAYLNITTLDGVAQVALNGEKVGEHANAHRPAIIDLTGKLRPGCNEIVILLESGLFKVADLPGSDYSTALETLLNKRQHLRQAQYQFGWDWNPRLVYLGLHGTIEIVWGGQPWLKQVSVLGEVSEDLASARIRVRPLFQVAGDQAVEVLMRLSSTGGLQVETTAALKPGETEAELVLDVPHPQLWWPRGHGEACLYPLYLSVEAQGQKVACWEGRTGLRRVEIDQPPHPETGRYFHLKINNRPIFCKGANWVPPELSAHEVSEEKICELVMLAEAENMNMLRLWGGGVWANHTLLDLCDERGFLLWHDLLFACAKYPADQPEFLAEVEREVAWGVREFSPHPALVVWCGNNEMEAGLWFWHYKEFGRTAPDLVLFHHAIPRIMAALDPTRPYWPSSPYAGVTTPPGTPTSGDQHPWGVSLGADDIDFWQYRNYVDRFPNEGGVMGCAPVNSLGKFLPAGERKMRSFAWEHHDNTIQYSHARPGTAYRAVEHWLNRTVDSLDLETYALASGLLQAEGLMEYILNYRRRWPSTGSAIYWMFNDSWPTVHGWGTFDYYLKRKLSFHPVRRAFQDTTLALADEGAEVGVYLINDYCCVQWLSVETGSFTESGAAQSNGAQQVEAQPYTSLRLCALPRDPGRVPYAILRDPQGRVMAQTRLLLRPFKDWALKQPSIRVEHIDREDGRYARYLSQNWVWNVILDPGGEASALDDVFDLFPGIPYEVKLKLGSDPLPVAFTGNQLLRG